MKHEDFRLRYNEIMFDERDLIIAFLKQQADLRYGNQMYEWAVNVEVLLSDGRKANVVEISLGKDDELRLRVNPEGGGSEVRNAEDLALGELSKILDVLPDATALVYKHAIEDMKALSRDYNINSLLKEFPFVFKSKDSTFTVLDVFKDSSGKINFEIEEQLHKEKGYGLWDELDTQDAKDLADHIKVSILRCSREYERLKKHLSQFGGNLYNFCENDNAGAIYITPEGTDLQLMVLDVSMENGPLEVLVSIAETRLQDTLKDDTMLLEEKDLTPANLGVICQFFDQPDKDLVELSDEQKVLVKKFKDVCAELSKAKVGIIRDDNCSDLLFLNMEHIECLDCSEHVTDKTGYHDITDFLQEKLSCITETYFYGQDHERILAKFV